MKNYKFNLNIIILAAGLSTRMKSKTPKTLHKIGNTTLIEYVINTAISFSPDRLIIVHNNNDNLCEEVNSKFKDNNFILCLQEKALGTADAVKCALPFVNNDNSAVLILYGDVPFITKNTIANMLNKYNNNIVMLTTILNNPTGYGRIIRDINNNIIAIKEENDTSEQEKKIQEINTGFYVIANNILISLLQQIKINPLKHEYYFTDIINIASSNNINISAINITKDNQNEVLGVNNKLQLEYLERAYQKQLIDNLLIDGVTIKDKLRVDIRGVLTVGFDCSIDINCIFEGVVKLGNNVTIEAGCIIKNVIIMDNTHILPYSIIDGAKILSDCKIGPYARIRPDTIIKNNVHLGNFVEIKNSVIGKNSKINHLTYIGDAEIGDNVNVGAGSITCNYDGVNKHKTIIEDNVFIGSGTMIVAPIVVRKNGFIAAGSTITEDTQESALTIARSKQITLNNWSQNKIMNKKENNSN